MTGGDVFYRRRNTDSFVGQIFTWINTTFPHPDHKLHNGGVPATGSSFFSLCLKEHLMYEDADLIILEFDINESVPGYQGSSLVQHCLRPFEVTCVRQQNRRDARDMNGSSSWLINLHHLHSGGDHVMFQHASESPCKNVILHRYLIGVARTHLDAVGWEAVVSPARQCKIAVVDCTFQGLGAWFLGRREKHSQRIPCSHKPQAS